MGTRHFAAAAALALLCGCGGGGLPFMSNVSTVAQVTPDYRTNDYPTAGANRDMWVIILGAVPSADAATLQQQTLSAMQRHAGIRTRFTTTPENYRREYKTVLVFNGPSNLQADALCRNPSRIDTTPNAGPELRIQAVFCRNDQSISEVYSRTPGGDTLSNPNFDALINETMTALYTSPRMEQTNEPK